MSERREEALREHVLRLTSPAFRAERRDESVSADLVLVALRAAWERETALMMAMRDLLWIAAHRVNGNDPAMVNARAAMRAAEEGK